VVGACEGGHGNELFGLLAYVKERFVH
jgi:hypothetical protein